MIVDSTDTTHLVDELRKEMSRLLKKQDLINAELTKKYKHSKSVKPKTHQTKWKNPDTNTIWVFGSLFEKQNNKITVITYPITQFNDKEGGKDRNKYLLFAIDKFKYEPKFEEYLVKIFDGHFIKRFIERNGTPGLSPYQVILSLPLYDETRLVEHFSQNEKWYLYLHKYGIAMIKNEPPFLYFDTYITLSQLKEAQKTAIKEHLEKSKSVNPMNYLLLLHELGLNPEWESDYFPKESIEYAIKNLDDAELEVLKSFYESINE